jgi:hypothetical protein
MKLKPEDVLLYSDVYYYKRKGGPDAERFGPCDIGEFGGWCGRTVDYAIRDNPAYELEFYRGTKTSPYVPKVEPLPLP